MTNRSIKFMHKMNVDKIKQDFPIYDDKDILYFDSACVSFKPRQVIDAINQYYYEYPACAGRSLHVLGNKVSDEIHRVRKNIAKFFSARKEHEVIFTRNTTEAINLVANSFDFGKDGINKGVVLTTDKEHNSNLVPWVKLAKKGIIKHKIIKTNDDNSFNFDNYEALLNEGNVKLVSVNFSSNLDGISNPVKEITKLAHDHGAKVLVDAAQAAGHKEINVKKLDIDFLASSGHKMLGPSGIGMLYGKEEALEQLDSFLVGGDTVKDTWYDRYEPEELPERFEAGLQNYAGMLGFGAAANYLRKIGMNNIQKHELKLNRILTSNMLELPFNIIGNHDAEKRGSILTFYSDKIDAHEIGIILGTYSIMVRTGVFCLHSWFNSRNIKGAVRFSSYIYNSEDDCYKVNDFINSKLRHLL